MREYLEQLLQHTYLVHVQRVFIQFLQHIQMSKLFIPTLLLLMLIEVLEDQKQLIQLKD